MEKQRKTLQIVEGISFEKIYDDEKIIKHQLKLTSNGVQKCYWNYDSQKIRQN